MPPHEPHGFSFVHRKSGEVDVMHDGRRAAVLRAADAARFLARASTLSDQELQHLMARVTGNYKRGNERAAPRHPRNR